MKYRLIIFDWQGTLTDPIGQIEAQFNAIASSLGLEQPELKSLLALPLMDIAQLVQKAFPTVGPHKQEAFIEHFIHYQVKHRHQVSLYPGMKAFLTRLVEQGHNLAIASSASSMTIEAEVASVGVQDLFIARRTADQTMTKPAPDMLLELMDELVCPKSETVMIGDSRCDFEAAQNAGVDFIGLHIASTSLIKDIFDSGQHYAEDLTQLSELIS